MPFALRSIVALALLASPAAAPGLSTPRWPQPTQEEAERFVETLYARVRLPPDPAADWADPRLYSAELIGLVARYRALAAAYGEADAELTLDPLCRCREWGDFALLERTARGTMNGTRVAVRFRNRGVEQRLTVWIRGEPDGVRVVSLLDEDRHVDLRHLYRVGIRRLQLAHGLPVD